MNPNLDKLQPYPFQRMASLLADITPPSDLPLTALSIGEPKHPAPAFAIDALTSASSVATSLGTYPPTRGSDALRGAFADWAGKRFAAPLNPDTQVLPVSGTREALFSFAQCVINSHDNALVGMPNPGYQIYEGAALLAGAEPLYLPCSAENRFLPDFQMISEQQWQRLSLIYLCSPGNPTGAVLSMEALQWLLTKSAQYNVIIASDECYSEIYLDEAAPPPGLLQAARAMGNDRYEGCLVFHSLSKRSNLPGLRSGCVAGDARLIERYGLYRTYHGAAMPALSQQVSAQAWADERHVVDSRALYRDKFADAFEVLGSDVDAGDPAASFYLWLKTPGCDQDFCRHLWQYHHVKVLPGTFLGRDAGDGNPGSGRVRLALVAERNATREAMRHVKRALDDASA